MNITEVLKGLVMDSGFAAITWEQVVMILVACALIYLAIVKKFEPMLLLTIAFGMLLVNLPLGGLMSPPPEGESWTKAGLLYLFSQGVKSSIFPCLIFMGVGAMTDFGPMLANPMSLLLGAAAQLGIYVAFVLAIVMGHTIPGIDFTPQQAAAIAIIGGADGPTAIFLATKLASELLAPIAVAAYSYMALIPLIQPPIMRLLTTEKERKIQMKQLRKVSQTEKIIFPIAVTIVVVLMLPSVAPLLGMFMLGNLFRESGVVPRLSDTAQNALINIVTIPLGLSVGFKATADQFLTPQTLGIVALGLCRRHHLPQAPDSDDHLPGPCGFCLLHRRRRAAGQVDVQTVPRQDQPPDRCGRRVCCAYGCPCGQCGRPEVQQIQLSADVRHGSQCGRRDRQCCGGGLPAENVRLNRKPQKRTLCNAQRSFFAIIHNFSRERSVIFPSDAKKILFYNKCIRRRCFP